MRETDQGSGLRREKREEGNTACRLSPLVVDGARGEMTSEGVMTAAVPGEERRIRWLVGSILEILRWNTVR